MGSVSLIVSFVFLKVSQFLIFIVIGVTPQGVDPRPFLSPNIPPFVEVLPAWNRMLEPNVPQDWLHRDNRHRHSISYPLVHRQSRGHVSNCSSNFSTPMLILEESSDDEKENRSCISYLCYYFKRCFSFKRGAIEDNEE